MSFRVIWAEMRLGACAAQADSLTMSLAEMYLARLVGILSPKKRRRVLPLLRANWPIGEQGEVTGRQDRHKKLIAEVTEARKAAGFSQRELSAKLKRSPSYISKFEAGERRLEVCEFLEVCDAIGEDAQALIGRVVKG